MTESKKIQKGTFKGSYTAPRKPKWMKWVLIVAGILVVLGVVGWLIWQHEMSKRLDEETYQSALESSEGIGFQYLNTTERNAQFQKHAGVTMDAYLESPRAIDEAESRYACAQLLITAGHEEKAAELYEKMLDDGQTPNDRDARSFYTELTIVAQRANDGDLESKARSAFETAIETDQDLDSETKQYLIELYNDETR